MADFSELIDVITAERRLYPFPPGFRNWPERFASATLGLLFPYYSNSLVTGEGLVSSEIREIHALLTQALSGLPVPQDNILEKADDFILQLCRIRRAISLDAEAIFQNDPAAESIEQVILCYPGFYAISVYRIANALSNLRIPLLPRMMSEHAHRAVGIDIHPAAQIGESLMIDHGTGLVIGGTAVIGNNVKLYQGVTLGALQVHKSLAGAKRHPTIEDSVVVYAHATILGDIVIGANSIVGGNTWITHSVAPNSVVSIRNAVRRTADPSHDLVTDFSI